MFGIGKKLLKKIKKAVDKAVEPIPPLRDAVHAGESLVKDLAKRYNDYLNGERTGIKPLHGGVNWDAYHHSELYDFVHVDASPDQVLAQVTTWNQHATELQSKGEAVGKQWDEVRGAWQGVASQAAGTRADDIRGHAGAGADWAKLVAGRMKNVADALGKAKTAMPPPPDHPLANVLKGSAVAGVSAVPAGPVNAGVRALGSATFGTFEQHQKNLAEKKKAVHVMQAYEQVIVDNSHVPDRPSTPDFQGPDVVVPSGQPTRSGSLTTAAAVPVLTQPAATGGSVTDATPGPGAAVPSAGTGPGTAAATASGAPTTTSGVTVPTRRPGPAPGSWQSFVNGGTTGGYPGVGLPGAGLGGGRGDERGGGRGGARGGAFGDARDDARAGVRGGVRGGAQPGVRQGFPGEAGRTAPGQSPFAPAGRGGKRDEDKEHKNELPQEYNLFGADMKVMPAVIGDDDDR